MLSFIRTKTQTLLEVDLFGKPRWQRIPIRSLQVVLAALRDLISDSQFSLQAMSLVYTTLITLVPLLAISFSVLKGFGVHGQIEPLLLSIFEGLGPDKSVEVSDHILQFVDNIKLGVLGALGVGLLIYAVIALMQKIEGAFNYIWKVGQDRTLSQRFSYYLSVLLMGPLLIFISAGITTTVHHTAVFQSITQQIGQWSILTSLLELCSVFLPWLLMAIGFTFFYTYMPNTKVRIGSAFAGGMVAALLWKVMGYVFSSFISGSANYAAVYAAFATLIVLMIWLYASWLVVLIGANISFYSQYPRYLRISRAPLVLSPHVQLLLGLSVLARIAQSHYSEENKRWDLDSLSRDLNVPILAVQKVLGLLEDGGILMRSNDEPPLYYPACPLDATPLQKAIDALEHYGRQGWLRAEQVKFARQAHVVVEQMNDARYEAVAQKPIAEVLI